jgi:hypothetical protein
MSEEHDQDAAGRLEEELRHLSKAAEQEQLEREISGNLTPEDEEMIDLREERLHRKAVEDARRESEGKGADEDE